VQVAAAVGAGGVARHRAGELLPRAAHPAPGHRQRRGAEPAPAWTFGALSRSGVRGPPFLATLLVLIPAMPVLPVRHNALIAQPPLRAIARKAADGSARFRPFPRPPLYGAAASETESNRLDTLWRQRGLTDFHTS